VHATAKRVAAFAAAVLLGTGLLAPRAQAAPPAFSAWTLLQRIQQTATGHPGTYGVYVIDLQHPDQAVGYHHRDMFRSASTVKVPLVMYVLREAAAGRADLHEKLTYETGDWEPGTGTIQGSVKPGDRFAVEQLCELAITQSDNIATNMLLRRFGWTKVQAYAASLGAVFGQTAQDQRTVTPEGLALALRALDQYQAGLDRAGTARLLGWLEHTAFSDRLPGRLPPGTTVAHKIGSVPGQFHDVGLVYLKGHSYVISVYSHDTTESGATEGIAAISRAVYDYISVTR
jgi:beta-lactamase class A